MGFHYNNFDIAPSYKYWTASAVDCYERGCVCEGCIINEIIGKQCRMKKTVIQLVKNLGAPKRKK